MDGYGELSSPGYPYDIPEYTTCRWILRAAEGTVRNLHKFQMDERNLLRFQTKCQLLRLQQILVESLAFALRGDGIDCKKDYLEIFDGDSADALPIGKSVVHYQNLL